MLSSFLRQLGYTIHGLRVCIHAGSSAPSANFILAPVLPSAAHTSFDLTHAHPLYCTPDGPHAQLADLQGYDYHPPLPDTEVGP